MQLAALTENDPADSALVDFDDQPESVSRGESEQDVAALYRRAKRLRYAAEFAASLYKGEAVARYLARMAPVQDSLGRYNDLCVALAAYRAAVGDDPRAWFAIGWLTARRDALSAESATALADFARSKPFWKAH